MSGPVLGCLVTSSMWTFGLQLFISYLVQETNVTILYVYFIFVWWIIKLKFINFIAIASVEVNISDVCGGIDLPSIMRKYEWLRLWNKSLAMASLFDISQLKSPLVLSLRLSMYSDMIIHCHNMNIFLRFSENCRIKQRKKLFKKKYIYLLKDTFYQANRLFLTNNINYPKTINTGWVNVDIFIARPTCILPLIYDFYAL